jgi:hypothetical protein
MKKKLRQLLEDPRLSENTEWISIQKNHQLAQKKWEKARAEKEKAREALKAAEGAGSKKDPDGFATLHTRYHQAKAMLQYHKLGLRLAEYQQKRWLESYMAHQPIRLMMDPDKLSPQNLKARVGKKQAKSPSKSSADTES